LIIIQRYEYGRLIIDDKVFKREHWKAFVKLNEAHNGKYFDVLHNGLRFKQYVGVLQIDGLLVQINPKADKDDADEKWQGVLLKMLKATGRLKTDTIGDAQLKRQHVNLLEVYFEYFLRELELLMHQGLVKKYRKQAGNVKALKGKLDFAGNIRHNLVHQERFFTLHQVYDKNHKLHQVLSYALEIVEQFTKGTRLNDLSKRTRMSFPEVDRVHINEAVLNSLKLDRKTEPYRRALELARLIILNYSPDINSGSEKMIALLFDMNVLWEEYILKKLKAEVSKEDSPYRNLHVRGQLSKDFWGPNKLVPDIVIEGKNKTIIIDTKWKRPGTSASVEDLRQVYTYARFWNAEEVMLLYPGNDTMHRKDKFRTKDFKEDDDSAVQIDHQCHLAFVHVLKADGGELDEEIGVKILDKVTGS
jgi:5-methylcytosine-specific restriction enzyme subunit McrC